MIALFSNAIALFSDGKDRQSAARRKSRRVQDCGSIENIIWQGRAAAKALHDASEDRLRLQTRQLRRHLQTAHNPQDESTLMIAAGAVIETVRQVLGISLFDEQLRAGIIIAHGAVAEMQTGEGKTLSGILPAYVQALSGHGVHVATPNDYLATRDYETLTPIFERLGVRTGLVSEHSTIQEKQTAYRCDITYGSAHTFGFDYLRDQIAVGEENRSRLGNEVLERLNGNQVNSRRLQRGLSAAIIDEIDHVLIDDAVSPLLLSSSQDVVSPDADVHKHAQRIAVTLVLHDDFKLLPDRRVELTATGFERVYREDLATLRPYLTHPALVRPWHEYVKLAIKSAHCYRRDVDYVVSADRVRIVDASTGRIFEDRTWSDGLQQAIEAREGLQIRSETKPIARITRQKFFRQYAFLAGMTGTAQGCEDEFASVYGLSVEAVPLRKQSRRDLLATCVCRSTQEKVHLIADEVESMVTSGRSVLIGTLSISESLEIAEALAIRGMNFQLLNGVQDEEEAALVASAGKPGAVTVATNLAGRGTDIRLHPLVAKAGGLHVIVSQMHSLARVDRQLIGRSARCGDPGSARIYVSAEDAIAASAAPWIARAILRTDPSQTSSLEVDKHLQRVQRYQQRSEFNRRRDLLKNDDNQEQMLSRYKSKPDSCWQL
ncbi:preprotein translocase subunit SecA [Rubripirellula amarantea]|nr:preprotein translocase subunit SecA [Rubripirellula amarantea]